MAGGRPKGSTSKNTKFLLNKLQEMYGSDFDPVMRMAEMATLLQARAMDAEADDSKVIKDAIDGWDKIAKYVTPALKAQEVTLNSGEGENGTPLIEVRFLNKDGS
jgi:hypothetical protein